MTNPWLLCFKGILHREFLRFLLQRERFLHLAVGDQPQPHEDFAEERTLLFHG